jgi:hypothetical protein
MTPAITWHHNRAAFAGPHRADVDGQVDVTGTAVRARVWLHDREDPCWDETMHALWMSDVREKTAEARGRVEAEMRRRVR